MVGVGRGAEEFHELSELLWVCRTHLISHQRDTAHDEQHRTGILRDFEAFVVFHGLHGRAAGSAEDEGDDVTDRLEDRLNCLVHNF